MWRQALCIKMVFQKHGYEESKKDIKQDEEKVTFAYIIKRKDERIDFNKTYKELNAKGAQ